MVLSTSFGKPISQSVQVMPTNFRVPSAQGKQGKSGKKTCQGVLKMYQNTGHFAKIQGKHREFPYSKGQGYCDNHLPQIFPFCPLEELYMSAKSFLHLKLPQIIDIF